jgi:predicted phage terminase large subunit-like protein
MDGVEKEIGSLGLDTETEDVLVECCRSTKVMAKVMFPDRFHAEFTPLHDQIFDLIDSGAPRIAIAAPRGIGKTSIVSLALAARKMLFQLCHFYVYVSNSATSGELQTENLKFELASNKVVRRFFGKVKTRGAEGLDETFSKKSWVALNSCLVLPRGNGQQVRGVLYHNWRPDLIVVDDLEDTEAVENEELRAKLKIWFNGDLLKCFSGVDKNWQLVYIDTLKHEDALLQDLLDSSEWESIRLEICDDDYNPTAPTFMPRAEIMKEVEYHREHGIMDVFYREFRNIPISTEDAVFRQEYFKHYNEPDLMSPKVGKPPNLTNVVIIDPAKTVKLHSAESAVVCWGISREDKKMYFRDCVSKKMYPDELYTVALDMVVSMGAFILAVEVTSLEQFIVQPIKNEMRIRGVTAQFIELKAGGGGSKSKAQRVATLAPHYRHGYIVHNKAICGKLETQLSSFPRSKHWDVMDAAAYITKIMEMEQQYFDPEGFEENENPEAEFEELGNDEMMDYERMV